MTGASGGANNMRPLSWVAQTEKIQNFFTYRSFNCNSLFSALRDIPRSPSVFKQFIGIGFAICLAVFCLLEVPNALTS